MAIQTGQTRLVLASASPRRSEFLQKLGLSFEVDAADIDERVHKGEKALEYVMRVARAKAAKVAARQNGALVLAADTSVVVDDFVVGKPATEDQAREMLSRLSGREHVVMSGVAIDGTERAAITVKTKVRFRKLSSEEIQWYVATGEPMDKAGAYGVQGLGGAFVLTIEGSFSNVIGLPMAETVGLLKLARFPLPWAPNP